MANRFDVMESWLTSTEEEPALQVNSSVESVGDIITVIENGGQIGTVNGLFLWEMDRDSLMEIRNKSRYVVSKYLHQWAEEAFETFRLVVTRAPEPPPEPGPEEDHSYDLISISGVLHALADGHCVEWVHPNGYVAGMRYVLDGSIRNSPEGIPQNIVPTGATEPGVRARLRELPAHRWGVGSLLASESGAEALRLGYRLRRVGISDDEAWWWCTNTSRMVNGYGVSGYQSIESFTLDYEFFVVDTPPN